MLAMKIESVRACIVSALRARVRSRIHHRYFKAKYVTLHLRRKQQVLHRVSAITSQQVRCPTERDGDTGADVQTQIAVNTRREEPKELTSNRLDVLGCLRKMANISFSKHVQRHARMIMKGMQAVSRNKRLTTYRPPPRELCVRC
jgi:hypothetical protein